MPDFDPSRLTQSERSRIHKRAQRNVGSEVTLILTAGFVLFMIVLFWFGKFTFLPIADAVNVKPTLAWICLSGLLAIAFASVHGFFASKRVAHAQDRQVAIHRFDEAKKSASKEQKIKAMKEAAHTGGQSKTD